MKSFYDPKYVEDHYDSYGLKEWNRFTGHPRDEVNLLIHNHFLQKYIRQEHQVLDIGSGPGRFAIEMAKIGAKIAVGDISSHQLKINAEKVRESGFEESILWRKQLDVIDLSSIADEAFDVAVCYGGVLSYIFDHITTGLNELLRVTKPGSYILFSVMSLIGTVNYFVKELFHDEVIQFGLDEMDRVSKTGNQTGDIARGHICKLYTWETLEEVLNKLNCTVVDVSASNYLSNNTIERIEATRKDPVLWERFLKWEFQYCMDRGTVNGGSHILVVLQKR